jgi:hypothetical protein
MTRIPKLVEGTDDSLRLVTESREFRRCSEHQKAFALEFLKTGNADHAIAVAYPDASAKSRRTMKYQVLRSEAVAGVLELWAWRDSTHAREHLIQIVREQLAAAEPGSTAAGKFAVQLERLVLGLKGTNAAHFQDPDEDSEKPTSSAENGAAPEFWVGQRVTERGPDGMEHVGIVKALDASGRPSEIEEVKS